MTWARWAAKKKSPASVGRTLRPRAESAVMASLAEVSVLEVFVAASSRLMRRAPQAMAASFGLGKMTSLAAAAAVMKWRSTQELMKLTASGSVAAPCSSNLAANSSAD